jgi:hypothetical protein
MPMLKEFKPGDGVVFKLRRGDEYLQLALTLGRRGEPAPILKAGSTSRPAATTKPVVPGKK